MRGARGDPAANRTRRGRPNPDRRCDVRRRRERSPDGPHRHDRQEECLDRPREPLPTRVEALPELPAAFGDALDTGLTELGLVLEKSVREQLDGHVRLLLAWNEAINLTAIRDPAGIAVRHVVDSLSGVALLRERGIDAFVDLGSGGGFPGLPLAAVLPARRAMLVESIAKKARFLAMGALAVGLAERVTVRAGRAEDAAADPAEREHWPAVTARAVAELAELVELAFPLLAVDGCLVAWKRDPAPRELAAGRRAAAALGGGRLEIRDVGARGLEAHRLVVVTKLSRTPDGFPRPPRARRRRPW